MNFPHSISEIFVYVIDKLGAGENPFRRPLIFGTDLLNVIRVNIHFGVAVLSCGMEGLFSIQNPKL